MSRNWNSMGRRRFIENLSALGLSSTTLNFLEQDELEEVTPNPEEEVPYVAMLRGNGDTREPVYKTLPREEWERRQTALNARDQISERIEELEESNISVYFTDMGQSPTDFGVLVKYKATELPNNELREPEISLEQLENTIPSKIEGRIPQAENEITRQDIPVVISENYEELACDYDLEKQFDDLPGGIPIVSQKEDGSAGIGTLNAPFYSREHGVGWTTAGHVTNLEDSDSENPVYQIIDEYDDEIGPGDREYFGHSRESFFEDGWIGTGELDYAFIEKTSDEDISTWITNPDGSEREYDLSGIVSNEELENQVGNEDYILKGQGISTCRSSGNVIGVTDYTHSVETDWDVEDRDSGGPLFYTPNESEAYIAGIMHTNDGSGGVESTTAETTEIELDGYFLWD